MFRHDLTLLNIFFRRCFNDAIMVHPASVYAGGPDFIPEQYIWQMRLNYSYLENLSIKLLHQKLSLLFIINRQVISLMILIKNINIFLKKKLGIIKV